MKNLLKIGFIFLFSVVGYFVISTLQQMNVSVLSSSQYSQNGKKEVHTIKPTSVLSCHFNRNIQFHYVAKSNVTKAFYCNNFVKTVTKKKQNKSVLAKSYFFYTLLPIRFKPIDIIFPFHTFW